jgi:hypothetical protein
MIDQESSAIIKADEAHKNYEQTVMCRDRMQGEFLKLGSLLKQNRDESLYKFLGYDDFNSYLGAPELTFHRSTAYKLIAIVELYLDKLNIDPVRLIKIGSTKLDKIKDVVENDVEGWLDKAAPLSVSSLNETIGRGPGKSISSLSPVPAPSSAKEYLAKVKSAPCCVCGREPSTMAHFPRTKVRCSQPWHVIPLCGECHRLQEDGGMEWCWQNRQFWGEWYYKNIVGE